MEKNTCKLCFRSFANGRALGGHMRSHVAATAKAAAAGAEAQLSLSPLPWASSDEEEEEEEGYGLRENPKKSVRLLYPEFSASVVVQDRESEAESSRATATATHRLRSKRPRPAYATPDPEPVSSVSDATAEEDVAISLMLLSRDTWKNSTDDDEEEEEEEEEVVKKKKQMAKGRSKYQCCTCKKVFRSYQALGGHRASHKKFKSCVPPPPAPPPQDARSGVRQIHGAAADRRAGAEKVDVHECPVCFRVFASGQALGGHKRSHLTPSTTTTTASSSSIVPSPPPPAAAAQNVLIDLNLPAPMEEDADQLSAVSDELNWGVATKR